MMDKPQSRRERWKWNQDNKNKWKGRVVQMTWGGRVTLDGEFTPQELRDIAKKADELNKRWGIDDGANIEDWGPDGIPLSYEGG
jgi:hypothetical protein